MVTAPKYADPRYTAERRRLAPYVAAGHAYCVEPRCLMPDRWIEPGTRWSLSHDTTGTALLGPSHLRCNSSEGATRGNAQRAVRRRFRI